MNYGMGQAVCPRCGSGADVRTVAELFDMLNGAQDGAIQQAYLGQPMGPGYPGYPRPTGPATDAGWRDDPAQEIAGTVISAAVKFAGRAIGRRMQRVYEDRIGPALEARARQAQQPWEQARGEQAAIVARHPDLRGCLKDQVVFLEGGTRTVPIAEIAMPPTLATADALVERLRQ